MKRQGHRGLSDHTVQGVEMGLATQECLEGKSQNPRVYRGGADPVLYTRMNQKSRTRSKKKRTRAKKYMSTLDRCWSLWFVSSQKSQGNCNHLVADGNPVALWDALPSWELGDIHVRARGVRGLLC